MVSIAQDRKSVWEHNSYTHIHIIAHHSIYNIILYYTIKMHKCQFAHLLLINEARFSFSVRCGAHNHLNALIYIYTYIEMEYDELPLLLVFLPNDVRAH